MTKIYTCILIISLIANSAKTLTPAASCFNIGHLDTITRSICEKRNKNYLVLAFLSPDCHSCERNIAQFKRLEREIYNFAHARVVSLGALQETRRFIERHALGTEVALDSGGRALRAYGVHRVPTIFVIDAHNRIVHQSTNNLSNAEINIISTLVQKPVI